jgi:hypothetical protein
MYDNHQFFLNCCARYDSDGCPSMKVHEQWANSLSCKVIRLSGEEPLNENADTVVNTHLKLCLNKS